MYVITGSRYAKGRVANQSNLALGVDDSSVKAVKMSGKVAIAWRFTPNAACWVSVPSSV